MTNLVEGMVIQNFQRPPVGLVEKVSFPLLEGRVGGGEDGWFNRNIDLNENDLLKNITSTCILGVAGVTIVFPIYLCLEQVIKFWRNK